MNPLIIEWIYYALASNDIKLALINVLKNYYKNQSLKAIFDSENVNENEIHQPYSFLNPNILKKLTSILKPSELSILQNEINKFKNPINSFKNSIMSTEIRTVKNYVNKFNNLFKENEEEIPNNAWEVLSSSWFKKGRFIVDNQNLKIGTLTTLFQSDNDKRQIWYGPYTYPTFPQEIWILMTQAKGKNGSGAGTIFWKFWNRKWLPSQLRKYVKSELAKKGKYYGSHVSTTAMTMKLSDRISVYPWDPTTGKKLEVKEQISTVDLSQKKNNKVYILAEDTEFLDIASPFTNEDTECQWNPTSNGVIDGLNYAYIIDTIVTQSLHQGEERHTFYSDNPFTYQGDYNEISVAQFRYNNMGYLTGNAFNWTTLYKLNHDEYSETEETTFSYPAKILPPSPQNIAKQIVIIPTNPSIEVNIPETHIFAHTQDKLIWDYNSWVENVVPKIKPLEININFKDYLDPTLLIKTFNDLKRYYKSVDVYLSYEYETDEFINHQSDGCSTTEIFKPSKIQNFIFSRDLKELSIYNKPLNLKYYEDNNITYHGLYAGYYGNGKIGIEIDRNEYNLYNIQSTYMQTKIEDNIATQSIENQKDTLLGFCDLSDKEFKWKIQLLPNIMQLELGIFSEKSVSGLIQYIRYYKYYKLNISKIVFNPR